MLHEVFQIGNLVANAAWRELVVFEETFVVEVDDVFGRTMEVGGGAAGVQVSGSDRLVGFRNVFHGSETGGGRHVERRRVH